MTPQPTSPTRRLPRRPRTDERPLAADSSRAAQGSPALPGAGPAGSASGRSSDLPWTLAGRYRMEEVIGRGGMSTVYRATDMVLDRSVAVKILLAALAESDPTHIDRFRREARAVAALHHPAVVKIYDSGVDEGRHFLVMECVTGRGLDDALRDGRALEPSEAVNIATRVAEALAAAHGAGILHRDVKPANVMLASDGDIKVLDFGIARPLQEGTLTQPASAMGTAAYMAPERIRGEPGDERSDIYALGCLLYAMLTGGPPFMAGEQVAVLHQQVHAQPLSPRSRGARVGPGLETLVLSMLAKDPAARPHTAAAVASGLQEGSMDEAAGPARDRGQPRWLMPVALLAAVVVLVVAVTALASGGGGGTSGASRVAHRHATGSYHEPLIQTTSPVTTTTPATTTPPAATPPPRHDGPRGRGPAGAGPPGHDGGGNGGGGNGQGDGGGD